jgi:cytochrome c-type biogenesis protein
MSRFAVWLAAKYLGLRKFSLLIIQFFDRASAIGYIFKLRLPNYLPDRDDRGVTMTKKITKVPNNGFLRIFSINPLKILNRKSIQLLSLLAFGAILAIFIWPIVSSKIEVIIANTEEWYQKIIGNSSHTDRPTLLIPLAFGGGLLASVSPCILAMLPVNLSYIGALNTTSKRASMLRATGFTLGAILVFSLAGYFSELAAAAFVEWRGFVRVFVGMLIIYMGLSFAEILPLPLPQLPAGWGIAGTFGAGMTFALVTSPCASPVLFAVLAAAAGTGNTLLSVTTMVAYAAGYTAIIFVSSVFTGLVKHTRWLLERSDRILRWGGVILCLLGGYYLIDGLRWFF